MSLKEPFNALESPPSEMGMSAYTKLHVLNQNEIIAVPPRIHSGDALWIYKIKQNCWIKWITFETQCNFATISVNDDETKLYMFGDPGFVIKIDLKTKEFIQSDQEFHDGSHCRSLFIDGKFHIFGGWDIKDKSHFIWNEKEQKLIEMHKFDDIEDTKYLHEQSMIYLPSTNKVLIMQIRRNSIYSYSLITNKCKQIASLDSDIFDTFDQAVFTKDGKYAICLFLTDRKIAVIDLQSFKLNKSKIESLDTVAGICIVDDPERNDIMTHGFIRSCWNLVDFSNMVYPPDDIIKIISIFISCEMLYMLSADHSVFFRISMDHILDFDVKGFEHESYVK